MKTYNHTHVSVRTVKTGLADAGAIDIDHRERMIYWSDHAQWTINRMSLVSGETEVKNGSRFDNYAQRMSYGDCQKSGNF